MRFRDTREPLAQVLSEQMAYLGSFSVGAPKKPDARENDPDIEEFFNKLKITFEQTHRMNQPNVQAAYESAIRFSKPPPDEDSRVDLGLTFVEEIWYPIWRNSEVATMDFVINEADIELKGKASGWPWSLHKWPFKLECYEDKMCQEWMENDWSQNLRNRTSIAQVTGKKECLPVQKLKINKLRNVMAVDAGHNMQTQRLTYKMNKKLNSRPIQSWSALGWSPYRRGMQQLAEHLGAPGFNGGWELDIASCESKIWENLLLRFAEVRWRALKASDQTVDNLIRLKNVYRMISSCPLAMPDGAVFLKGAEGYGGNLTGQVGTAHDNTLFGLFLLAYAFIILVGPDLDQFRALVRPITLGDDITFTVHDDIIEDFNGPAIAEVVHRNLGVVLESPEWKARPFYQLGFLSMHFIWDPEYNAYLHRVDRDKLFSSLLQGGTNRTPTEQLQRISGMRNVSWGDRRTRQDLDNVYWMYRDRFDKTLGGTESWETAKKSYVSDAMLEKLFLGFESSVSDNFDDWLEVHATSFSAWREHI